MSQSIDAVLSSGNIAVNDVDTEPAEAAAGYDESEAVRARVGALWVKLKENGGNEDEGQRLFLDWHAEMIAIRQCQSPNL